MSLDSNAPVIATATAETAPQPATEVVPVSQRLLAWLKESLLGTLKSHGVSTLKYMCETEVHTYAFSVAANAILSFFPALVLIMSLSRKVFHSTYMQTALQRLILTYIPDFQDKINMWVMQSARSQRIQLFSLVMLFVSCTGVFLPLEVALNRIWKSSGNRSYLMNQVVSLGLALACGLLLMIPVAATAGVLAPTSVVQNFFGTHFGDGVVSHMVGSINGGIAYVAMKIFALTANILGFFLIYWLLPNAKVPPLAVLPAAITTGFVCEVARHIFVLCLPLLDFRQTYGPFSVSVTLIFWTYVVGLLMLGGAHLSAVGEIQKREAAAREIISTDEESLAADSASA
ncbi:MAG TPA: YihY/virulence factor BrkB family protein [candidate division Zixibacteria bacterium]|nr:YihY/virulence factor BrkB family protein [candidate division Zixibacteria bacterium]